MTNYTLNGKPLSDPKWFHASDQVTEQVMQELDAFKAQRDRDSARLIFAHLHLGRRTFAAEMRIYHSGVVMIDIAVSWAMKAGHRPEHPVFSATFDIRDIKKSPHEYLHYLLIESSDSYMRHLENAPD